MEIIQFMKISIQTFFIEFSSLALKQILFTAISISRRPCHSEWDMESHSWRVVVGGQKLSGEDIYQQQKKNEEMEGIKNNEKWALSVNTKN